MSTIEKQFFAGLGRATAGSELPWIEAWYPQPVCIDEQQAQQLGLGTHKPSELGAGLAKALGDDLFAGRAPELLCVLDSSAPPQSVEDAYLRLHLLSMRLVKPHQINLEGLFGILPTLCWTDQGPKEVAQLPAARAAARGAGEWLRVYSVDKFPALTDYVIPSGVRIADTARVRLGAYLGEGTTVMHEGFINFNAGTLGKAMVEGRLSAGVVVGVDSDVGGGASTMGTLSGGGGVVISVGRNCLLGANSGLGIALGDNCIVEAGLYLTAAVKVQVLDEQGQVLRSVRASQLSGADGLLFIRNSQTGAIQARPNRRAVALNPDLHAENE